MMPLSRMLDSWRREVAGHPPAGLRDAVAARDLDRVVDRIALAAIIDPDGVRTQLGPLARSISTATLGGAEIVHALACAGVPSAELPPTPWLPSIDHLPATPRGALRARGARRSRPDRRRARASRHP
jgi:hypothetical protein